MINPCHELFVLRCSQIEVDPPSDSGKAHILPEPVFKRRRVILLVILSNGSPLSANQPVNHFPDL